MKKIFMIIMIASAFMHNCFSTKSNAIRLLSKVCKINNSTQSTFNTITDMLNNANINKPLFYDIKRKIFTYYINPDFNHNYIPFLKRKNTEEYEPIAAHLVAVYYAGLLKAMRDVLRPSIELREAPGKGVGIYQFFKRNRPITPIFSDNVFNVEKDEKIKHFFQFLVLVGPCGRFAINEDESRITISGKEAIYTCTINPFKVESVARFSSTKTNNLQQNFFGSISIDSEDNVRTIFTPESNCVVSLESEINNDK